MSLVLYWQRFCAPYLRGRFGRSERGASLVEYALLVALIAVVALAAITLLGTAARDQLNNVGNRIGQSPGTTAATTTTTP